MNTDSITLALSRRVAIADGRNQQQAMVATARKLRASTCDTGSYNALGDFITCTDAERHAILNLVEGMING